MELWTRQHALTLLPAMGAMALIAWVLRHALGKKDIRIRMIPLQIIACILVLLEIGKQLISLLRGYDLYHLPLHFCSLFVFLLPLMAFYRGKAAQTVHEVVSAFCAALFLLMSVYPNLIYPAYDVERFFTDYMSFHTVAFHNLVMLAFVLIVVLQLHTGQQKRRMATFWGTVVFCVVAATMAQLLKTNYANFYTCNIPVLETVRLAVRDALGPVVAQLLYILINSALHLVFIQLAYSFYRFVRKLFAFKREPVQVVAALIWQEDRFMICQRPAHKARGLLWEFVGGKVEPGETREQALIRECREELAVTVEPETVYMEVLHEYPDITVNLTLFHARIAQGIPQKLEHNDIQWITPAQIGQYDFCPADTEILARIKKDYLK